MQVNPYPTKPAASIEPSIYAAGGAASSTSPCGGNEQPKLLSETAAIVDPRKTMAGMTREMSLDFFNTAVPVKNDLLKMTTYNGNPGITDGLKAQGAAQVQKSFDNAEATAMRSPARYGMDLTKEQQVAQKTALDSGRALAEVDAANRATLFQKDINKQLMSGIAGASGIAQK